MIKKILIGLGTIIVLILTIAFFAPKDYFVEREVIVNKPKAFVFNELKYLKKHYEWNPWIKLDPKIVIENRGTDGTVGFVSSWAGNDEVGVGEEEIKSITEGERIDTELRFKKPMEDTSQVYYSTEAIGENQTKVKWGIKGMTKFPFNIICFFMNMTGHMEKEFDKGLNSLKAILEK